MSKKNNLAIRARQHAFDLKREKEQRLEREKKAEKHKRKIERQAAAGVVKKKTKGIRIRKGVRIRGIKVTDADSRREALQRLKAEAAMSKMDIEEDGEGAAAAGAAGKPKRKKIIKIVKKKKKSSSKASAPAAAAAGEAMEA